MSEEQELIHKAIEGDELAFESLILTHQKMVYNLALRMTGNPEDALDVSQEAFLKAWRGLSTYHQDSAFSTWLYRLTSNACIDFLRKQKRNTAVSLNITNNEDMEMELSIPDPTADTEHHVMQQLEREDIAKAMQCLEPEYRQALILRVVNELSYEEIGQVLQIKAGTVKSRIARAREKMRILIQKDGNISDYPSSKKTGRGCDKR